MSLRSRFAIVIGGVVTFVLALFSAAFLVAEKRHRQSLQEEVFIADADRLAGACVQARISHDELPVLKVFRELADSPGFREAMCWDNRGAVTLHHTLTQSGERALLRPLPSSPVKTVLSEEGQTLWSFDAPAKGGAALGGARIVVDPEPALSSAKKSVQDTLNRLLLVGAVIVVVALVLSWATARTLTLPIQKIAEGARNISGGHWETRVSTHAPGELGGLAHEFNSMASKLGELDRLKDQFVYAVSHDLRNPLGAILASAKMLGQESLHDSSKALAEVIESGAARLNAMVNNILDVACLQDRTMTFSMKPFALAPLLNELLRLYDPLAKESGLTLALDLPDPSVRVNADEEKVFRIFLNILTNAVKFSRAGDRVTVSAKKISSDRVECAIRDTGPGIPPDRLERLFVPFQSTKDGSPFLEGSRRGSGLGLSLVKALVEGHGGCVEVVSQLGRGTTFLFTLPAGAS